MRYRVDPEFKHKIMNREGGASFKTCFQCGTCTAKCPVSQYIDLLRPNKIIHLARLGIKNHIHSDGFWLCIGCNACVSTCPQGVDLPAIMHAMKSLAAEEHQVPRFLCDDDALREIPFPYIYTWLCLDPDSFPSYHYTMNEWVRRSIQGFLQLYQEAKPDITHKEKIAVIGSGPAGLSCAWELNRMGFPVTVFEASSTPGGMLRVGLPEHRLPKHVLYAEIRHLKDLGIRIRTDSPVDPIMFQKILRTYQCVFIATGAHKRRKLHVEGEGLDGVIHALDFLRQANLYKRVELGRSVIVVGGGGVAIDAARTALHIGAEAVQMVCLESRNEMPGHEWEIQEALTKGVILHSSWGVKRMLGNGQKISGVEFIRCVSVFDETGRFNPSFDETGTKVIEADTVILAIGQTPDLSFLGNALQTRRSTIMVNPLTMETNMPGVFAGGDVVTGSATVVEAIAAGKEAAKMIERYMRGLEEKIKSAVRI